MIRWEKAMEYAYREATYSSDLSTQNGAVICAEDGTILIADHNRFPAGVGDSVERRTRPFKYHFTEHCERNAIYSAVRYGVPTVGHTMVTTWVSCAECVRAAIQSGIERVVRPANLVVPDRWRVSFKVADAMLTEARIEVIDLDHPVFGIFVMRNEEWIEV